MSDTGLKNTTIKIGGRWRNIADGFVYRVSNIYVDWTDNTIIELLSDCGIEDSIDARDFFKRYEHVQSRQPVAKIGIDTGTNTGIAVSVNSKLVMVRSMTITEAMALILAKYPPESTKLFIEDARKWIGFAGKTKKTEARRQGAGSIKRDATTWRDWCKQHGYQAVFVKPIGKHLKKDAETFERITGWQGRTNGHGRDAGMIVWGR